MVDVEDDLGEWISNVIRSRHGSSWTGVHAAVRPDPARHCNWCKHCAAVCHESTGEVSMIDYTNASLPTTPLSWDGAVAIDVKVEASDFWVWFDSMADKVVFEVRILFFKKRV